LIHGIVISKMQYEILSQYTLTVVDPIYMPDVTRKGNTSNRVEANILPTMKSMMTNHRNEYKTSR